MERARKAFAPEPAAKDARSLDLLVIDDVQFLGNKRATLEELIYTIDAVQARGGQVVLSSDRPASELQAVSVELAARFQPALP